MADLSRLVIARAIKNNAAACHTHQLQTRTTTTANTNTTAAAATAAAAAAVAALSHPFNINPGFDLRNFPGPNLDTQQLRQLHHIFPGTMHVTWHHHGASYLEIEVHRVPDLTVAAACGLPLTIAGLPYLLHDIYGNGRDRLFPLADPGDSAFRICEGMPPLEPAFYHRSGRSLGGGDGSTCTVKTGSQKRMMLRLGVQHVADALRRTGITVRGTEVVAHIVWILVAINSCIYIVLDDEVAIDDALICRMPGYIGGKRALYISEGRLARFTLPRPAVMSSSRISSSHGVPIQQDSVDIEAAEDPSMTTPTNVIGSTGTIYFGRTNIPIGVLCAFPLAT
ncbi:hypothetical protein MN608_00981 [Microdochium nivale]|nr:hypothetical protein MN608_00981 [Microdochium nivale]